MRLIRQSFLWYKEGNSDKVYEIDLCEVGADKYVVNFRYGRRGAALKEATKTPVPVSLAEAEKIYEAVETEKLQKGYSSSDSGTSSIPKAPAFQITATVPATDNSWMNLPAGATKPFFSVYTRALQTPASR
jgi:predicted DNA-binding WGR domain protein